MMHAVHAAHAPLVNKENKPVYEDFISAMKRIINPRQAPSWIEGLFGRWDKNK